MGCKSAFCFECETPEFFGSCKQTKTEELPQMVYEQSSTTYILERHDTPTKTVRIQFEASTDAEALEIARRLLNCEVDIEAMFWRRGSNKSDFVATLGIRDEFDEEPTQVIPHETMAQLLASGGQK